jgi:transposase
MPRRSEWAFRRRYCLHLTGEPSCKNEARIGQKNGLARQWARRGTRPRQPADQRYDNAYLFGAICPARGVGAALALPYAGTDMQLHLDEISRNVTEGAHAVLLLDRAGWHTTGKLDLPENITPIFLPSRAPELNPVENVWQYLRQTWLSNTVFENYDAIVDSARDAWRKAHRPARTDHIHRHAKMGPHRSALMTLGNNTAWGLSPDRRRCLASDGCVTDRRLRRQKRARSVGRRLGWSSADGRPPRPLSYV